MKSETLLLIDAAEAGWEPSRGGRLLELCGELQKAGKPPIAAALVPNLGGVWTDIDKDIEVVRLGYPDPPRPRAFDPFDPVPLPENLFIRHWERIVYGRSVKVVLTLSGRVRGAVSRGIEGLDVEWWELIHRREDGSSDKSTDSDRTSHFKSTIASMIHSVPSRKPSLRLILQDVVVSSSGVSCEVLPPVDSYSGETLTVSASELVPVILNRLERLS